MEGKKVLENYIRLASENCTKVISQLTYYYHRYQSYFKRTIGNLPKKNGCGQFQIHWHRNIPSQIVQHTLSWSTIYRNDWFIMVKRHMADIWFMSEHEWLTNQTKPILLNRTFIVLTHISNNPRVELAENLLI